MKTIVIYSSKTGNTKLVAEKIAETLKAPLASFEEMPDLTEFTHIALGYWVDRGMPNGHMKKVLSEVSGKKLFLFGTLGADPHSEHGEKCKAQARKLVEEKNEVLGEFLCQGKIDPNLIEMFKQMPKDNIHAYTEENAKRYHLASTHPDEKDLAEASLAAKKAFGEEV